MRMLSSAARACLKSSTFATREFQAEREAAPSQSRDRWPHWLCRWDCNPCSRFRAPLCRSRRRNKPLRVDLLQPVVGEQTLAPELLEDARLRPFLKAAVDRAEGADACR